MSSNYLVALALAFDYFVDIILDVIFTYGEKIGKLVYIASALVLVNFL